MANEGEWPKADGDILYASDLNGIHNSVMDFYSGTTLNYSNFNGSKVYEFSLVEFNGKKPDFLELTINGRWTSSADTGYYSINSIYINKKESGGSYNLVYSGEVTHAQSSAAANNDIDTCNVFQYMDNLSLLEQTSGVIYQVILSGACNNFAWASNSFKLNQAYLEAKYLT